MSSKSKMDHIGPVLWAAIHVSALYLSDTLRSDEVNEYKNWLLSLVGIIPCSECKGHWHAHALAFSATTRAAAFEWTVNAHNTVNKRIGKPVLSVAEAYKLWNGKRIESQSSLPDMQPLLPQLLANTLCKRNPLTQKYLIAMVVFCVAFVGAMIVIAVILQNKKKNK